MLIKPPLRLGQTRRFNLQQQYARVYPSPCTSARGDADASKRQPNVLPPALQPAPSPTPHPPHLPHTPLTRPTHLSPTSASPHPTSALRLPFLSLHHLPQGRSFRGALADVERDRAERCVRDEAAAGGLSRANADTVPGCRPTAAAAACVVGLFYLSVQVKFYLNGQVICK